MANLTDAFNDCIDRLNAGDSIENCLHDYPEHAERLRQLLQTSALIYQAHDASTATHDTQDEVRATVIRTYRTRGTRQTSRRNWFIPLAAVASAALVVGILAWISMGPRNMAVMPIELTSTSIAMLNSTTIAQLNATETQSFVALDMTLTSAASFDATAKPALTATPAAAVITMTHPGTVTPPPFGTPMPTLLSGGGDLTAVAAKPSSTPVVILPPITEEDIQLTVTALAELVLADGTPTMEADVIPTSVAGMTGLPPTLTPSPTGTMTPSDTPMPTGSPAPSATYAPQTPAPTHQGQQVILPTPTMAIIPMNAGEIEDNARWDNYLIYRANFLQQYGFAVHDVDVSGRQIIRVTDQQDLPVLGARVQVYAGQTLVSETLTYATGETLFFPNARPESRGQQSFRVVVEKGGASGQFTLDPQHGPLWDIQLQDVPPLDRARLDVLFLLDTTGSMGDELAQLQNNILGISSQIDSLPGNIDVRYGLVTYRDRGDEYVTRLYDFTTEVAAFQSSLNSEYAAGGGDTPESLNEALHNAIQNISWRGDDTVKLVFLVADAQPHLDYPQDYDYAEEMAVAAERGIKIHPIASSGLDQVGEYIFRQMAVHTMGHFIFLTYEQGTAGSPGIERPDLNVGTPDNPTTQQDQGDYTVERLDDLVLRLITDELSALSVRATSRNPVTASKVDDPPPPLDYRPLLLLALVGGSFLVGFSLNLLKPSTVKRKRKNDEHEEDWTDMG